MNLRTFEEFLNLGLVKKVSINKARADSLKNEAFEKRKFLDLVLSKLAKEQYNPNFIIDNCYDILIELIRAKMLLSGFNSDSSHEAEISYLRKLNFPEKDVQFMNELKYYRNGIKYYGKILDLEYALKVLKFMNKTYVKLEALLF